MWAVIPKPEIFSDESAWMQEWAERVSAQRERQRCTRCVYTDEVPGIVFDEHGVCSYCRLHNYLDTQYPAGEDGQKQLEQVIEKVRKAGRGKAFDVVVGVSGGCDSSALVWMAKQWGLRPLAVHFDNTWNSQIAVENIHTVLDKLGVELYTHVVDNEVYDDIYRSFLLSGVPDIEAPTDIGLATTLYLPSLKYGIPYQFEGHSFRTEGVSPLGWMYMDGKYIESVVRQHGHFHEHGMRTYPNLTMARFLRFMLISRVKKIRPLYWMEYNKEETKKKLTAEFGWKWYGGHHLENRFTAFYHGYFLPRRWRIDGRANGFSALIRSGQMTRADAISQLEAPPTVEPGLIDLVKKRLGFSDEEFVRLMTLPFRSYRDYKTYKRTFERMRPFFWLMYKLELVPQSFYIKYTARNQESIS